MLNCKIFKTHVYINPQPERKSPDVLSSTVRIEEPRSRGDPGGGVDLVAVTEPTSVIQRGPQRTGSLPPRRPPPPPPSPHSSPQHPPQQRLTRALSQAAPPRPHDPPIVSSSVFFN